MEFFALLILHENPASFRLPDEAKALLVSSYGTKENHCLSKYIS